MVDLHAIISQAGSRGIALGKLLEKSKLRPEVLESELKSLREKQQIAGPFKLRHTDYYYPRGFEPGGDTASRLVEEKIQNSGRKLITKGQVAKTIKLPFKKFFEDAVRILVGKGRAVELKGGNRTYLLHIDAARDFFPSLPALSSGGQRTSTSPSFEKQVLDAYHTIKGEQGGLSAVSIGKLMHRLGCSKQELHRFLLDQAHLRQADLHPSTSLALSPEDRGGAIAIPGKNEPGITVTFTE